MKHRLLSLVLLAITSILAYSEGIDAIYVSSSNPAFTSVCYLLKKRPVITYSTDKAIVTIDNDEILVIPLKDADRIKVEYGTYDDSDHTSIDTVIDGETKSGKCKKHLIDNNIVILRNGILYNVNGTLYTK